MKKELDTGFKRNVVMISVISIAAVTGFIVSGLLIMRSAHSEQPSTIAVGSTQGNTRSLSGAATQRYDQIVDQYNTQGVHDANQKGGSFIPVIKTNDAGKFPDTPTAVVEPKPDFAQTPTTNPYMSNQQHVQVAQQNIEPQGLGELFKEMNDVWRPTAPVKIGIGDEKEKGKAAQDSTQQVEQKATQQQTAQPRVITRANTFAPSVLDSGIITDKPSRVFATVVQGPLSGAKVSGTSQRQGETVEIKFTLMTFNGKSYAINAIAIDQDTMRSAMEGDVDHKYFQRYGLPIITALLRGYGEAMATQNSTVTTSALGSVTQAYGSVSDKQVIARAIGSGAQTATQQLSQDAGSTQPSVTIPQNTPFGLAFMEDVVEK
mgnify:CR=1 FL=1